MGRHGPMVLSVCRAILRHPHDAEDAFQATFLILVKKGRTIRGGDALGGWLHQVAHRVAIQANAAAARRRTLERRLEQMAVATAMHGPPAPDELLAALHEEIARLPEKCRLAVVTCDPQGMTQAQAAGQLQWSERTIHSRLAEGRARLKRLTRRGLAPDDLMLSSVFLREAKAAVPAAWTEAAVRAALATVNHTVTAGVVSAAVHQLAREVSNVMLFRRLTGATAALLTAGMIGWGASAALVALSQDSPRRLPAPPAPAVRPTVRVVVGRRNQARPTPRARFRCAAECSTPTASQSSAPGCTCATMPKIMGSLSTRWPRGKRGEWQRLMRPAGSISNWTRA